MKYRFECAECGYAYKSFWYEPNWIARRFYEADHKSFHYNSWLNDYHSQWKRHGAEIELERIIKLIEPLGCPANGIEHDCQNGLGYMTAAEIIALIKGEK